MTQRRNESREVMSTSSRPLVSVVVAARNCAHQLPTLLEALADQTLPRSEFELIVVDDGSSDGTSGVIEANGIGRAIRSEVGVGLPRARNIGIRAAAADIVALTDADTVPDGHGLSAESHGWLKLEPTS